MASTANEQTEILTPNTAPSRRLAFSLGEVAEQLGVSVGFLRLEVCRGRLRTVHLGRRVLIREEEVRRYLTIGETVPSAERGTR